MTETDIQGIRDVLAGKARWHMHKGHNLDALRAMETASVDAVVTDAPYGLRELPRSVVEAAVRAWLAGETYYPPGGGFLGHEWDSFVPGPELWREVLRVLRPGGYALVFAGPRTVDLMGLSMRLAGFDIRDTFAWLYGSGFPKSVNASKALDKSRHGGRDEVLRVTTWIRERLVALGLKPRDLDRACGTKSMASHWTSKTSQPLIPTAEQWSKLAELLGPAPEWMEPLLLPAMAPGAAFGEREVLAQRPNAAGWIEYVEGRELKSTTYDITAGATEESRAWENHGTAVRPANEPIVVARKPLEGTLAENLRRHSTGALAIGACRVGRPVAGSRGGRFPPNVAFTHVPGCKHLGDVTVPLADFDGDEFQLRQKETEVLEEWACVPGCPVAEVARQSGRLSTGGMREGQVRRGGKGNALGTFTGAATVKGYESDEGSASRFYPQFPVDDVDAPTEPLEHPGPEGAVPFLYTPKPNRTECNAGCAHLGGNRHPTLKPLAGMRWLVRLVGSAPRPDGRRTKILDPFVGSGTTVVAAGIEGMDGIGIDDDAEAVDVARARCAHWLGAAREGDHTPPAPIAPRRKLASGPLFGDDADVTRGS